MKPNQLFDSGLSIKEVFKIAEVPFPRKWDFHFTSYRLSQFKEDIMCFRYQKRFYPKIKEALKLINMKGGKLKIVCETKYTFILIGENEN